MNTADLFRGIQVTESKNLCQHPKLRPARPHRRRRIQKKWKKRHGMIAYGCVGHAYEFHGQGIVACPHVVETIRKATACAV